jgi:hypothetical protein
LLVACSHGHGGIPLSGARGWPILICGEEPLPFLECNGYTQAPTFTTGCYRSQCTRAKKEPRIIGLLARDQYEAMQAARRRQETEEFRERYAALAGIEATHEQAIRRCGLRHARYFGQATVHFQHVVTAAAINLVRVAEWLEGKTPAPTRHSAFARLQLAA